ncbi:CdaR family transcriptional regulator [Ureibacillus acetophenoni]|uniref:CdaR family transcriptional regulator n=1 Tax=Ureibacillus acetophenoni TaxID=614649 RepID=A0A285U2X0_9BACL|nr:sugar diacid recognition domain-containing protein [Ureibacillus acetophenoni]SOC36284.1 CdaR family transcriptional regulator [Ureibacillus acetophenoni]
MFDLQFIGTKIVDELKKLIEQEVVVIDHNGFIIASTDISRINQFHEGSILAMKNKQVMHMTKELAETLKGVREGLVMPLIIEDTPIGVIGVTGKPSEIEKYGKLVQRITELFVEDFLTRQEKERDARMFEFFLVDLLSGRIEKEILAQRVELMGIETEIYNRVIIVKVDRRFEYNEINFLNSIQTIHPKLRITQWSFDKLIMLVPNISREQLQTGLSTLRRKIEKRFKSQVCIGVGNCEDFYSLSESYNKANIALTIAIADETEIVFEEDLTIDLLLSEIEEYKIQNFLDRTIKPIISDEELLLNLEKWLNSNTSLQEIANELHIHKNTLKYRLKKIEKLLDLDLNHSKIKLDLNLAIYLYRKYYQKA